MFVNGFLSPMLHALWATTGTFSVFAWNDPHMSLKHSLMVDLDEPLLCVANQCYMARLVTK